MHTLKHANSLKCIIKVLLQITWPDTVHSRLLKLATSIAVFPWNQGSIFSMWVSAVNEQLTQPKKAVAYDHVRSQLTMHISSALHAPVQSSHMAWLTLLSGDTSTACRRTVPALPIRVESSRGPLLVIASTRIWRGFWEAGWKDRVDHTVVFPPNFMVPGYITTSE